MLFYKLDDNKNLIPCEIKEVMGERVEETRINPFWISTVFLGISIDGRPFETMIRDEKRDGWLDYQERYYTWKEAEEGHKKAIEWVKMLRQGQID